MGIEAGDGIEAVEKLFLLKSDELLIIFELALLLFALQSTL
jgi:hypothetical protein